MSALDKLDRASTARKHVEVILDAALDDEWQQLRESLADAAEQDLAGGSLARPATTAIVNRMEEIRADIEASRVYFLFEPADWTTRVDMAAEHPPRDGNRLDLMSGYNVMTYTPAIIRVSCLGVADSPDGEPEKVPDEKWLKLLGDGTTKGTFNFAQVNRLFQAAHRANETESRIPPSARSLLETQDSGASLAQPSPGKAPARSGSKGGSRRTSRSRSTTKKAAASAS